MLFAEIAKMSTEIVALKEENTVLRAENKQLREELNEANETIEKLKSRLKKDSTNSSKPSSTDGFKKKVHNFREKTGRKVGGQFGHKGHTLVLFKDPTEIINHLEGTCSCGGEIVYNTKKDYYNDERCLFERLINFKEEHLRFIEDFKVPFTNNLAEKSLRMIKAKTKISGGFRSNSGGKFFANIRSIISTAKKQKLSTFDTIYKIFSGQNTAINFQA